MGSASALGRITVGAAAEIVPDVIVDPALYPRSDNYRVRVRLPNAGNRVPDGFKCPFVLLPRP